MSDRQITAVYVEIGCVTVYEVLEEDLDVMESGSPAQRAEAITFALLGLAVPSLLSVTQFDPKADQVAFTVALAFGLVCLVGGVVVALFWHHYEKQRTRVFKKVRARNKSVAVAQGALISGVSNG